ncbi:26S proteasome non-ATPase regulatory subunit 4 [Nosema granulosis]|uniref:26S proteasome non-ATPase regulatory subunit 4 n=1 Tax=Nosema granulosis TaxID=83296 RepID=A0A9P6H2B9_9MICR|nr:26S proteasome non-ATPase regulatory subunit 4 [Nosema granulosis]
MPEITVVIYDNGLASQNQDYLPSRSLLQKEFIQSLISRKFEADSENLLGIIPLNQPQFNNIITPTKQKDYLYTFLNSITLGEDVDYIKSLNQALHSFKQREISTKHLILFLGSEIDEKSEDDLFAKVFEVLTCGISLTLVFFGENMKYYETFINEIEYPNFKCIKVDPNDDVNEIYSLINGEFFEEEDPELAEAIRQSLADQKK